MALTRFRVRGGDDWLLFAERVDAPDDDRAYYAVTEIWPVWLDIERRHGVGTARSGLHNPDVLALVAAQAEDRDFSIPSWAICDACNEPYRFVSPKGIHTHCGCECRDKDRCTATDVEAAKPLTRTITD